VWNLAVEQHAHWRPGRAAAPGYLEQCRQLTAARKEHPWLAAGSQTVQQQALRDFAQAMTAFFDPHNPAGRPGWRKAGRDEGFRIVGRRGRRARVKRAIARLRARETDRRKDWAEKASTDLARRFDVIRVEDLRIGAMTRSGWGLLVRRLQEKAPGRVEKISPAFTSQRCSACGQVDGKSCESQAVFRCTACGFAGNADVNAARNIVAGHAVTARGGHREAGPVNREPQLLASSRT
jgi:Putative transposase DNA-binding domain/Probable transposase